MNIKDPCGNCGSIDWRFWRLRLEEDKYTKVTKRIEICDKCEFIRPTIYRDAAGNPVSYSEDMTGKYSYATDSVWHSKKELAEHCQKYDLIQKGNDVNIKDSRIKQIKENQYRERYVNS